MHLRELLAGYELGMTQMAKIRSHSTRVHPSRIPPKTYVRPLTWGADTHELCFYLPRCAHQVSGSVALTPPQKCFAFPVTMEENSSFLDPAHDEWDKRARYGGRARWINRFLAAETSTAPGSGGGSRDPAQGGDPLTKVSSMLILLLMVIVNTY